MDMLTSCVDSNWNEKYIYCIQMRIQISFQICFQSGFKCVTERISERGYNLFLSHSIEINHIAGICPEIH